MEKSKYVVRIAIVLSITLLFIGLISYYNNFDKVISTEPAEWADFATYLSLFVSISNLIFLGVISYITYKTTSTFNNLQTTPLLDFTVKYVDDKDSWYLINCSNASARNISVRFHSDNIVSKWVACYSIVGSSELELPWLRFATKIEAAYTDAMSENYFITSYENLTGEFDKISKSQFETILPNRLNNVNLLLALKLNKINRQANFRFDYSNINDYINDFAIPVGLVTMP